MKEGDYCDGKLCYEKRTAQEKRTVRKRGKRFARRKANKNRAKRNTGEFRIYHCPKCNLWHLTHRLNDF